MVVNSLRIEYKNSLNFVKTEHTYYFVKIVLFLLSTVFTYLITKDSVSAQRVPVRRFLSNLCMPAARISSCDTTVLFSLNSI